jgi:hypothetical protein
MGAKPLVRSRGKIPGHGPFPPDTGDISIVKMLSLYHVVDKNIYVMVKMSVDINTTVH